jgi:hypothetical protein
MQQLTNAEEQWNTLKLEKAFMKDLPEDFQNQNQRQLPWPLYKKND